MMNDVDFVKQDIFSPAFKLKNGFELGCSNKNKSSNKRWPNIRVGSYVTNKYDEAVTISSVNMEAGIFYTLEIQCETKEKTKENYENRVALGYEGFYKLKDEIPTIQEWLATIDYENPKEEGYLYICKSVTKKILAFEASLIEKDDGSEVDDQRGITMYVGSNENMITCNFDAFKTWLRVLSEVTMLSMLVHLSSVAASITATRNYSGGTGAAATTTAAKPTPRVGRSLGGAGGLSSKLRPSSEPATEKKSFSSDYDPTKALSADDDLSMMDGI